MSSSFQIAPGKSSYRPANHRWPAPGQWYTGLTGGDFTNVNILFYGDYNHDPSDPSEVGDEPGTSEKDYWSDAISYNRQLDKTHFSSTHKYRIEWELPDNSTGFEGYLRWFLDDQFVYEIDGRGLRDAGEGAEISTEPSYLIFNTAVSKNWGENKKLYLCHYKTTLYIMQIIYTCIISPLGWIICNLIYASHISISPLHSFPSLLSLSLLQDFLKSVQINVIVNYLIVNQNCSKKLVRSHQNSVT